MRNLFKEHVVPSLKEKLGCANIHQVPRVEKVVVNCGIGSATAKLLQEKLGIDTIEALRGSSVVQLAPVIGQRDAARLIDLSFGRDPAPVKMSTPPQSIGLEDRFLPLQTEEECRDKLKWLLGRLVKLLAEDGRTPATIKVTARDASKEVNKKFHKESRQCKVSPSLFQGVHAGEDLTPQAENDLLRVAMQLLGKMSMLLCVDSLKSVRMSLSIGCSTSTFQHSHGKFSWCSQKACSLKLAS